MDRPAWQALMAAALHADGVRVVLIEKLDRLARDLMIQESVIADLRKYGFELVSACEPDLMATDATRVLLRQMLGAVALRQDPDCSQTARRQAAQEGRYRPL